MSEQQKSALAQAEEATLQSWAKHKTFEGSLQHRAGADRFVFYDGPPFANGLPHWGGLMTSALKDAVMRYKTMQGYYAPRRFGWDCHGLPPELLAEKELGISGKKAIRAYGVEKFVAYCRDSVLRFTNEWHDYVTRIGRWVDFADDYRTMDPDYMESVIWAFKQLYDKGLIFEGERVVPYSYGAHSSLSNSETRQDDSYRDREDLTATVKFKLADGRVVLGWTTTPWTLPANMLLAVNPEMEYAELRRENETVILAVEAKERYAQELTDYQEFARFAGSELVGLTYEPLFPYFAYQENAFRVVVGDFVEAGEGTGIVHIAPGHGEDDYWLGKQEKVAIISPVDDDGRFTTEVKDYVGRLVFDANGEIVADLDKQGKLFAKALYTHKYPHCWRTDVPIIYRAMSAWFVDVPKIKDELLAANQEINWYPNHVKDGAFGKWLENAREWNISRNRFWGAPLPVWKTDDGELIICGSLEEIRQRAVNPELVTDLHRPHIDAVELKTDDGRIARRIEDVFDCWFESGSMPFAQAHYPFENKELFESGHPADFITEYVGQTRGWFYTLHVMSVALFGRPAFKNAVAHGIILGSDGRKMSKRLGNYPDLYNTFNTQGADAVRFYLLSSSLFSGETAAFDEKALIEAQRNVIARFKNVHSFYATYAELDGVKPLATLEEPKSTQILDRWIIARLNQTIQQVTEGAEAYDTPRACRAITEFLDDLSNWYVRRSRRRFWKTEDDSDKVQAYATLQYVLARTSQLLAPWAPLVSEEIWQAVVDKTQLPVSVHLSDWPSTDAVDESGLSLLETMATARTIITEALAQRAQAGVKVRQPLATLEVFAGDDLKPFTDIIMEEVNVKRVKLIKPASDKALCELNTTLSAELRQEGLVRDIIRHIQSARKSADLMVDDRIVLDLSGGETLEAAIEGFGDLIKQETLATQLGSVSDSTFTTDIQLAGETLSLRLKKAGK